MKVLRYNEVCLTWLGLLSKTTDPVNNFMKTINSYIIVFGLFGLMMISTGTYGYVHRDNFVVTLRAVVVVCAGFQCVGAYFALGVNMKTTKLLHRKLQGVVDDAEKTDAFVIYKNIEDKCEKNTKFISWCMIHSCSLLFGSVTIYPIVCMILGNYDTSTWYLPYNLVVPFETESIFGWYTLLLAQAYIGYAYSLSKSCITTYFMCCCSYVEALCQHFEFKVKAINKNLKQKKHFKNQKKKIQSVDLDTKEGMKDLVEHHILISEIFNIISDVNSGMIFSQLPCNVLLFAAALYQTEHTIGHPDILIFYDILCIMVSLTWPYFLCDSATSATLSLSHNAQVLYDADWYDYPLDIKRHLPLIIARSQESLYFSGLKVVQCTLETFMKLNNNACSYYLMFRNISNR